MFVESKRGRREGCVVKMHSQLLPWIMYIQSLSAHLQRFFLKRGESSEEQSDVHTGQYSL